MAITSMLEAYLAERGQDQQHDQWNYDEGPHLAAMSSISN
jgi:hypothetical protein